MVSIPEVKNVQAGWIKIDESNPNDMTERQFESLKKNILTYGFLHPIITNKDGVIADGEHRYRAGVELGMTEIPTIVLDVGEVDRQMLRQVLNKLRGEHDVFKDVDEYKAIMAADRMNDFEDLIAIDKEELLKAFDIPKDENAEEDFDADEEYDKIEIPTAKEGDVIRLGDHVLVCRDSTVPKSYDDVLGGENPHMTLTDPPYNVNYGSQNNSKYKKRQILNDSLNAQQWSDFTDAYMTEALNRSQGDIYIFMSCAEWPTINASFNKLGGHWSSTIIWAKNRFVMSRGNYHRRFEPILYGWKKGRKSSYHGGRSQNDLWEFSRPNSSMEHPTMKPVSILRKAILNSSLSRDIVLDPFGGSGSTLIACEQTGRRCRMIELDPKYCDIIIKRWEQYTGKKAQRITCQA